MKRYSACDKRLKKNKSEVLDEILGFQHQIRQCLNLHSMQEKVKKLNDLSFEQRTKIDKLNTDYVVEISKIVYPNEMD